MVGKKSAKRFAGGNQRRQGTLRAAIDGVPFMESLERRLMLSVSGQSLIQGLFMAGSTFNYTLTDSAADGSATQTYTAKGKATAPTGGQSAYEFDTALFSVDGENVNDDQDYIASTSTGVVEYEDVSTASDQSTTFTDDDAYSPPNLLVPANVTIGQQYDSDYTDTDNSSDSSNSDDDSTNISEEDSTITVAGEMTITVPAGTFDVYELDDANTQTNLNDDGSVASTSSSEAQIYLSPGIGLIEEVIDDTDDTVTSVLSSYTLVGDKLSFPTTPADTVAGQTMAPVTVDVLNADGTIDTTSSAAITLSLLGGNGALSGKTTVDAVNGVATFSGLSIDKSGDYTFQANSIDGSGPVTSNQFKITGDHLVFTTQPGDSELNASIPMVVTVEDQNDAVDTDADGTIDLTLNTISGGDSAVLGGTISVDIVDGVGTFTTKAGPTINAAGTYTLTATQVDDTDTPVDTTATGTSDEFTVSNSLIWTGGGDGVNWSDPKNWDKDAAPDAGATLLFPASHSGTINNDIAGLTLDGIDIQGSNYTLNGNGVTLSDSLSSEGTGNTYNLNTALDETVSLDDTTGDLVIAAQFTGAGGIEVDDGTYTFDQTDSFTGPTTLDAGVTIDDDALNGALGTGAITIGAGSAPVSFDDGGSGTAEIDNEIDFQDGAVLDTDPNVILGGSVVLAGSGALAPVGASDELTLEDGTIGGTGTLTLEGDGTVDIQDNVLASASLLVQSGITKLAANLKGLLTGQVTVTGGDLGLSTGLSGTGGIDVQGGTLQSAGSSLGAYGGEVTLESGGEIDDTDTADDNGLGTGTLDIMGGTIADKSGAGPVELGNPTTVEGDWQVISAGGGGSIGFTGVVNVKQLSELTASGSGPVEFQSVGGAAGMSIGGGSSGGGSGSAPVDFSTIDTSITLENDATDVLGGSLNSDGSVTIDDASTIVQLGAPLLGPLFTALAGAGSITIQSGALETLADGLSSFTGDITLDADGTINYQDGADGAGLGSGTLDVKGGSIDDLFGGNAQLDNPVTVEGDWQVISAGGGGSIGFTGVVNVKQLSELTASGSGPVEFQSVGGAAGMSIGGGSSGGGSGDSGSAPVDFSTIDASITLENDATDVLGGSLNSDGSVTIDDASTIVQLGAPLLGPLFTALAGAGSITIQSGVLASLSDALDGYTGDITLDAGGTINYNDTEDGGGLGTGTLDIKGGTLTNTSGGAIQIDNPITLEGDLTIVDPVEEGQESIGIYLSNMITVNSAQTISLDGEAIGFGTLSGDGPLTIDGTGNAFFVTGTATPLTLTNTGNDYLSGELTADVTINGADSVAWMLATDLTGNGNLTPLNGTGNIDVQSGTLVTDESEDAPGLSDYTGNITLESDGTLKYYDTQDGAGFGTGTLDLKGGTLQNSTGGAAKIDNAITLEGNVTITSLVEEGQESIGFYLSNTITVNSPQTITLNGEAIGFGTITGDGPLTVDGTGSAFFVLSTATPLTLTNTGNDYLSGVLSSDVTINGADTVAWMLATDLTGNGNLTPLNGTGNIDVQSGTLVTDESEDAPGLSDYTGNITLESDGTLKYYDTQDGAGFGTGTLDLKGGTLQNSTGGAAKIDNAITLEGNVTITSLVEEGQESIGFYLSNTITVNSPQTITLNGEAIGFGTITGDGPLTVDGTGSAFFVLSTATPLTLTNTGNDYLSGVLSSDVTINGADTVAWMLATDLTGNGNLTPLNGTGNIDVQSGTLVTDESEDAPGLSDYTGNITLESDGTLKYYDTQDGAGFGTGTLDLKGGTLQNSSGGAAKIDNPITLEGNVTITSLVEEGQESIGFYLSNTITIDAPQTITLNGEAIGFGTITGDGPLTVDGTGSAFFVLSTATPLTLTNTGTDFLSGLLSADATINDADTVVWMLATDLTGNGNLSALNGTGNIDVQSGTLVTDETADAPGLSDYNGAITLDAGGTLKYYDTQDGDGFGTGTLDLKGGTLQNSSGGLAIVNNPIVVNGPVTTSSQGQRFKLAGALNIASGSIDVIGILVIDAGLKGSGAITLDGDELDVAGSNPTYTGNVTVNSGTIIVDDDNALGTGDLVADLAGEGLLESAAIGDPVLDNHLIVQAGTLDIQGQFTFPSGVTIDGDASLDLQGAGTQVDVSGPLAGTGDVVTNDESFQTTGATTGFTGDIDGQQQNPGNGGGTTTPTTVPNGPFALVTLSVSSTEIDLFWHSNSNNESGFTVERSTGGGAFVVIATLPAGTISYQNINLDPSTTYEYRVRAFNSKGNSSYTGVATATTLATGETPLPPPAIVPTTVPNGPFGLVVTPFSPTEIVLNWHDNADNEAGFAVERSLGNSGDWTVVKLLPANTTTFNDTTLQASTVYTYRVRAFNAIGNSSYAGPTSAETLPTGSATHTHTPTPPTVTTVPNGPYALTGHSITGSGISLQWHDNSDNEDGFILERQTGNGLFEPLTQLAPNTISFVDNTAVAGDTYTYRVYAFNDLGDSSIATSSPITA